MDAFGFGGDDAPAEADDDAPSEPQAAAAEPPAAEAAPEPKEMRGGLHKFDPDEVDVEGGDATADDLMDAFGFGGEDEGDDAPAEAADDAPAEPPAAAAEPKEMRGGL